ncbi:HNH endonuclease [Rhizobium sp. CBN3]|uniref:HNH endonuclease n=1 Tax=Rhizobium sp. CBN3 TaxID=3058045 RepID=UPI0034A08220
MYCSKACARRNAGRLNRKKERARLRTQAIENVDPIKVFDRDKWKCQICGCTTPRKLRGTYDDRAPELDHIMPLSLGGAHSYMNTQCACRRCNAAKSNTPPIQASLFAHVA